MVKRYAIPWCGRAGRIRAGRGRAGRIRARDRRAGRRCARDRSAAPAHEITLNTALALATLPTQHLKPRSRMAHRDGQAICHTLVWPCWASQCSGPACSAPQCSGLACCTRTRDHSQNSTRSRHSFPQEHLNPRSRINLRDGQAIGNTLVWPCWASQCSGPACCTRTRDHSQHSTRLRHSFPQSILNHGVA